MQGLRRPTIETARLLLEPLRVEHANLCFHKLTEPDLYTYVPQDPPNEVADLAKRYQFILSQPPEGELWLNWFGKSNLDGTYICFVQATVRRAENLAMLAYQTFFPYRRQGFAKEACKAVIDHLRSSHGVSHFKVEMDMLNIASRSLVEALHFHQTGITKQADHFKGRSSDEFVYELVVPLDAVSVK